jgi:hypothetical protein
MFGRHQLRRPGSVAAVQIAWSQVTLALLFAAAATSLIVVSLVGRSPLISIVCAAMVALLAWLNSSECDCDRITLWDGFAWINGRVRGP